MCFGVRERSYYDGTVAEKPKPAELNRLKTRLRRAGVESIAICFLHAYRTPDNEKLVAAALDGLGYLCCSHDVCPEFREYERSSTTLINAYVGPLMDKYLGELERGTRHSISIMQSNGGFMATREARRHAIRTVLSGPAGGVVERWRPRASPVSRAFWASTWVVRPPMSAWWMARREKRWRASIDGFPVRVPMLDIHTVGAGGRFHRTSRRGRSAARWSGERRRRSGSRLLWRGRSTHGHRCARRARAHRRRSVSGRRDASRYRARRRCRGYNRAETQNHARRGGGRNCAGRQRQHGTRYPIGLGGTRPRSARFALVAFGGCGGLHACEIARELGIRTVLVPEYAGALSALGMLLADQVRDHAAGVFESSGYRARVSAAGTDSAQGAARGRINPLCRHSLYGQSYELTVPWHAANPAKPFHQEHRRVYGYQNPEHAIEIVTCACASEAPGEKAQARNTQRPAYVYLCNAEAPSRKIHSSGAWRATPVLHRADLSVKELRGPALVVDYGSTTLVSVGWRYSLDKFGNLKITS